VSAQRGIADAYGLAAGRQTLRSRRREESHFADADNAFEWYKKHVMGTIVSGVSREDSIVALHAARVQGWINLRVARKYDLNRAGRGGEHNRLADRESAFLPCISARYYQAGRAITS
jgi:hypothetical protein